MTDVYINKITKYLPGEAISNQEMESYLGLIDNKPSKAKPIILRNNGIKTRYYALDKNGNATHDNATLTKQAIALLFDENFGAEDIALLSTGTATPDQLLPAHASMVHGLLQTKRPIAVNTASGICCSGMNALNYGYLALKAGIYPNAVCTGSERVSAWLRADKFQQEAEKLKNLEANPIIAFQREFLRWMLSDGAAALLLENKPRAGQLSLKIEFIDFYSYAHELEPCMYAGGHKQADGSLTSWMDIEPSQWLDESIFSINQDTKLLGDSILIKGAESLVQSFQRHQLQVAEIDYIVVHISSNFFKDKINEAFEKVGIHFEKEKWFYNLPEVGNVGSASIFIALEDLFNNTLLQKGQKILLCVPESGRFTYAVSLLTVC